MTSFERLYFFVDHTVKIYDDLIMTEAGGNGNDGQVPLGNLLRQARERMGLSVAQVAAEIGINVNSLSKYEKAGVSETGQFPPANKLAALSFFLEINPLSVLLGCLPEEEYATEAHRSWDLYVAGHPVLAAMSANETYLEQQYTQFLKDVAFLKNFIRVWLEETGEVAEASPFAQWMRQQACKIVARYDAFDRHLMGNALLLPQDVFQPISLYKHREDIDQFDVTRRWDEHLDPEAKRLWKKHLQAMLDQLEEEGDEGSEAGNTEEA